MATAEWFILMTVVVITVSGDPDPCLTSSIWTDGDSRSINCHENYDKCDRYMEPGWYRVQSESGQDLTMPTSPVPVNSCGTKYPIWLNGSHPNLSDGIVERDACVASLSSTCHASYQIKIKNCQDFMAYFLIKATGCNERYCFGNAEGCPQPTTQVPTSTESQFTDTGVTGDPDPCLTSSIWTDGDSRSINCHVNYDKCDRYMEPGWYRVQSKSGQVLTMPTSPVLVNSCGTKYPIWLNGSHPNLSDGIVDRDACVASLSSTCHASYQIKIKNCQDFMAYYLVKATGCNERYCFGNAQDCPQPTTQVPTSLSTEAQVTDTRVTGQPDPCLTSSTWTDGDGRSINCHVMYDKCDRYMEPGWYRVQSESGQNLSMPTSPVPLYSCGTKYPIWLNGNHPSLSDGIVVRDACVASLSSTCHASYQIKIKNCQDFMAYYLIKATGCNERYCFGDADECNTTTPIPTSIPTTSAPIPTSTPPIPTSTPQIPTTRSITTHTDPFCEPSTICGPDIGTVVLYSVLAVFGASLIVVAIGMLLCIQICNSRNMVHDQIATA